MTGGELTRYEFTPASGRRLPRWQRTVFIADDGTIFAPAIIGGGAAVLCAAFDGVRVVGYRQHAYVPVPWLRRNYPEVADALDRLEASLAAAATEGSEEPTT